MRLLQIANIATRLGGTGACAYDVTRALVGHEHRIVFVRGIRPATALEFECESAGPEVLGDWRRWSDVVLCHNVSRRFVRDGDAYYSHSRTDLRFATSVKLRALWCVSRWLANRCSSVVDVVPQPVSNPPAVVERNNTILRICTPRSQKWRKADLEGYYQAVSARVSSAVFVFVGCPRPLQESLRAWCAPRPVEFHNASLSARSLYSSARVLLYTSSQKETYGRTVCEAQQAGCIPVVSNHSGLAEQVIDGWDGFTVTNPVEASQAAEAAFARFPSLSQQATESGLNRGSLTRWADRFLTVIM